MVKASVKSVPVSEGSLKNSRSYLIIRNVYLYLVAVIGLITFIIGAVGMIDHILQNYVFHVTVDIYNEPYPMKAGICAQTFPAPTGDGKTIIAPSSQEIETCVKAQKEQQEQNQRNMAARQLSSSIAQIAIGLPLWLFHWMIIQKDYRKKREEEV